VIERTFHDWQVDNIAVRDIASDTRHMPAVIARLTRP